MAEKTVGTVQVKITAEDHRAIQAMIEDSPFARDVLLRLALRIGIQNIRKDPSVLMPFLAKKNPPPAV
jgi:hypothetical protein